MKTSKMGLRLYRGLYWANQGLLHAVRALQEAEFTPSAQPASTELSEVDDLNDKLRRTQAMIEETRTVMNRNLAEWIDDTNSRTFSPSRAMTAMSAIADT